MNEKSLQSVSLTILHEVIQQKTRQSMTKRCFSALQTEAMKRPVNRMFKSSSATTACSACGKSRFTQVHLLPQLVHQAASVWCLKIQSFSKVAWSSIVPLNMSPEFFPRLCPISDSDCSFTFDSHVFWVPISAKSRQRPPPGETFSNLPGRLCSRLDLWGKMRMIS